MPRRVGIAGYRGYSGAELVKILEKHEQFEPVLLEHRSDASGRPAPIGADSPRQIACTAEAATANGLEAALLATPPEVSMELAPAMLAAGIKVVDLSGAFRLETAANYKRWYKEDHTAADLLPEAVYGLTEFHCDKIRSARLIANPGCYPTAANLAIQPLIAADLIDRELGIVCDAKSGVSGAGRKPSLKTHFCEVTENFSAYSLLDHRHVPEVLMNSGLSEAEFSFVAQLIPIHRGILETIYFRAKTDSAAEIVETYVKRYAGWSSVRVYEAGAVPDVAAVARTNYCDIGVHLDPATRRAVVVSAIDNLGKGAAGQAVQNLNLMFGHDHFTGLA
jgi:N-acetyl-gamma-glutamyl-phosphate reductase